MRGFKMERNSRIAELQEIYNKMDADGQKKMIKAAVDLINAQEALFGGNEASLLKPGTPGRQAFGRPNGTEQSLRRVGLFAGIPGYLLTGLLLIIAACVFWITLINPALLKTGITPPVMLRVILTALCGMFCLGTGLFWFILRKLTVPWLLLAVGACILCVEPGVLTDFLGFALIILIAAINFH